nr:hypothetical protein [uncultured Acidovorax sp.]
MSIRTFTKAADSIPRSKPNETSVHIQRLRPAPLRSAELQDIPKAHISANGKVLISPVPSQAELEARRKSERLEIASADVPVRNSTVKGPPYTCPELRKNPYRPGSADAFALPSRTSFRTPLPA